MIPGNNYYMADQIEIVSNMRGGVIYSNHRPVVGDLTLL